MYITLVAGAHHVFAPRLLVVGRRLYLCMSLVLGISLIDISNYSHPAETNNTHYVVKAYMLQAFLKGATI